MSHKDSPVLFLPEQVYAFECQYDTDDKYATLVLKPAKEVQPDCRQNTDNTGDSVSGPAHGVTS
jgi:hypothetical protein